MISPSPGDCLPVGRGEGGGEGDRLTGSTWTHAEHVEGSPLPQKFSWAHV